MSAALDKGKKMTTLEKVSGVCVRLACGSDAGVEAVWRMQREEGGQWPEAPAVSQ
jgi:hypothetical protein